MRLDKLLYDFESQRRRVPYVAIVKDDGSVKVQHSERDNIEFPSKDAFKSWIKDNNLDSSDHLQVITVNSQGKMPQVK